MASFILLLCNDVYTMPTRRRSMVRGIVAALGLGSAGCLSTVTDNSKASTPANTPKDSADAAPSGARGATDLVFRNETDGQREITVTVDDMDSGKQKIDTKITLESYKTYTINNKVLKKGNYSVEVSDDREPGETLEWKDADGPLHIIFQDNKNIIFAEQIG